MDAELQSDRDAENEAIALKSAMYQVANGSSLGLVILDACRDNPFAAKIQRSVRIGAIFSSSGQRDPHRRTGALAASPR